MAAEVAPAAAGGGEAGDGGGQDEDGFRGMLNKMMLPLMIAFIFSSMQPSRPPKKQGEAPMSEVSLRNIYGTLEECDLWMHHSLHSSGPPLLAVLNETLASEQGFQLLWHERVWYEKDATSVSKNVSVGPFPEDVLNGTVLPYVHATMVRTEMLKDSSSIPEREVLNNSMPLVAFLRELNPNEQAGSLFGDADEPPKLQVNKSAAKLPYFKTKVEVRPVFDHTVHTTQSLRQPPMTKLAFSTQVGLYKPFIYLSDFWLLEKDFLPVNATLQGRVLNLTLTYNIASMMVWGFQEQMMSQWSQHSELGLTDSQRDSFMVKRLITDTNPYLLGFSCAFIMAHLLFNLLAFKNDIQFWRQNESMQGLSARSYMVSFVCQLITTLYLLDSQETSRVILFQIVVDLALGVWKLKKAVKVELKLAFPFVSFGSQPGYDNADTSKYDDEAMYYMLALLTPVFLGYCARSAIYDRHRGWYSFFVSSMAGGVYTFGFCMMTPQLYINYKLKSVEHLPWRAMTYKAMNTFVDDVAAFLIDMPMMHRLSCFRDDVIFFVYLYQRWKYRVDKSRPSMWVESSQEASQGEIAAAAAPGTTESSSESAASLPPLQAVG